MSNINNINLSDVEERIRNATITGNIIKLNLLKKEGLLTKDNIQKYICHAINSSISIVIMWFKDNGADFKTDEVQRLLRFSSVTAPRNNFQTSSSSSSMLKRKVEELYEED